MGQTWELILSRVSHHSTFVEHPECSCKGNLVIFLQFIGSGRYIPGSDVHSSAPGGVADPFTGECRNHR